MGRAEALAWLRERGLLTGGWPWWPDWPWRAPGASEAGRRDSRGAGLRPDLELPPSVRWLPAGRWRWHNGQIAEAIVAAFGRPNEGQLSGVQFIHVDAEGRAVLDRPEAAGALKSATMAIQRSRPASWGCRPARRASTSPRAWPTPWRWPRGYPGQRYACVARQATATTRWPPGWQPIHWEGDQGARTPGLRARRWRRSSAEPGGSTPPICSAAGCLDGRDERVASVSWRVGLSWAVAAPHPAV